MVVLAADETSSVWICGRGDKDSSSFMMGLIKLFPSSASDKFLEATTFSRCVPFGFDSISQGSATIGIPDKGHTLKGFPWKCSHLCSPSDNRMGNL